MKAMTTTGLILFPAYDWEISRTHPERQERLLYTQDQILEEGLLDIEGIQEFKAGLAGEEDVQRVHFCVPDVAAQITPSHSVSAGGCIEAARLVLDGVVQKSFALVRPPGHHAMRVVQGARGFCNINIEGVMVEWVRRHYPHIHRIAIVDTDCHHGDGTQDIYWHDPDVLYISLHQDGRTLYPGTGFPDEAGGPLAHGLTMNVPLPPRTSDAGFLHVIEHLVRPVLDDFRPDLVINSAGQDNHYSDPITDMAFTAGGYARLNERLAPDICVLEGGYSIESALPYINTGIILALAGMDYTYVSEPDLDRDRIRDSPRVLAYIEELCAALLRKWRSGSPKAFKAGFEERHRSLYYDTDGISESQREVIRLCRDCPGALRIESLASTGYRVLCIHIPWHACERCRSQAEDWFAKASVPYYAAYLQDMDTDQYRVKLL